jgi:hypothetical protein
MDRLKEEASYMWLNVDEYNYPTNKVTPFGYIYSPL